jgi:hypothetical protein
MTIIDQGWVINSGTLPKAAHTVANEEVDTIPDRAASVLDTYHITLDGKNDKNRSTSNLFNKHEIFEHPESLP